MFAVKDLVFCRKCGSSRVLRVYRKGFMQERIYPHFGYYPWRCMSCGDHVMLRKRKRAWTKIRNTSNKGGFSYERKKFLARKRILAGRSARRRIKYGYQSVPKGT